MKRIKKLVATALACAMVFAMSATAFAAENETADEPVVGVVADSSTTDGNGVTPRTTKTVSVGNGYKNMTGDDLRASHGTGWFYYQVTSSGYNGWVYQINCLMYDCQWQCGLARR